MWLSKKKFQATKKNLECSIILLSLTGRKKDKRGIYRYDRKKGNVELLEEPKMDGAINTFTIVVE
ncbi:hypothetical protein [Paenibacillus sp. B1-33]|uniref:hypothetical protein n=1 Tax=unclassified Paenibacillus TaxID=185978 RepID=UPI003D2C4E6E